MATKQPKARKRKAPKVSKSEQARRLHKRSPKLTIAELAERVGLTWMGTRHALKAKSSRIGRAPATAPQKKAA